VVTPHVNIYDVDTCANLYSDWALIQWHGFGVEKISGTTFGTTSEFAQEHLGEAGSPSIGLFGHLAGPTRPK
jgi:hypothetical protein